MAKRIWKVTIPSLPKLLNIDAKQSRKGCAKISSLQTKFSYTLSMDPERSKLPILVMLARGVLVAEGPVAGIGATVCTGGITVPATGAGGTTVPETMGGGTAVAEATAGGTAVAETIVGGSADGTPVANGS